MNLETQIFPPIPDYVDQQFDPKRWERKQLANNLMIVAGLLRRKPLSIENLGEFDLWKRDLQKACSLMLLKEERHWAMVNWFIATRLDQEVHADRREADNHRSDRTKKVTVQTS